jgi:hypothetical protein
LDEGLKKELGIEEDDNDDDDNDDDDDGGDLGISEVKKEEEKGLFVMVEEMECEGGNCDDEQDAKGRERLFAENKGFLGVFRKGF